MDFKSIKVFKQYGNGEVAIYLSTVAGVVFINLLAGVALGFALSLVRLLWKTHSGHIEADEVGGEHKLNFVGNFSFVNLPMVASELERERSAGSITLDFSEANYIDHAIEDLVKNFEKTASQKGLKIKKVS